MKNIHSITLEKLLHSINLPVAIYLDYQTSNIPIFGLSSDSRHSKSGDLFCALNGAQFHGFDFIKQLSDQNIAAILYDPSDLKAHPLPKTDIPLIPLENLTTYIFDLATIFYAQILASLKIIGITGTEGKTSVAQFIAQALEYSGKPCGYIGTNGIGRLSLSSPLNLRDNTHTTPDYLSLLSALSYLKTILGANPESPQYVALEVTSHALDQARIRGLRFEAVVFTNLNRDHLDYHQTFEAYGNAKSKLFTDYNSNFRILNLDDDFTNTTLINLLASKQYISFGLNTKSTCNISKLELLPEGLNFMLTIKDKSAPIATKLYGDFMASNLAATAAILHSQKFSFAEICQTLSKLTTVTGRMQKVIPKHNSIGLSKLPTVLIDYAHKPNALLHALISLKQHIHTGKLICVFGCGGDRDRGKRSIMGNIAANNADIVIITSDNPRTEKADAIITDILEGIPLNQRDHIYIEADRKMAINAALEKAIPADIILIAGKGHETYQIIGHTKSHFDDQEIVINYWEKI